MIRLLSSTLRSTMPCQLHPSLGRESVLFAFEGAYRFVGVKSASESKFTAIAGWLNPDRSIRAGGAGRT
ncbi:hypothetical protein [Dendronalium sp. ChiSLP03b]|uniref:hypothetical protein n=1 Tax=Dendronalium sp. ChiSLP03b TaxID=3075381 RepID=UPI002ADB02A5|nr:hypothetical protein [Dendronalium sp. ChiSLP03b]